MWRRASREAIEDVRLLSSRVSWWARHQPEGRDGAKRRATGSGAVSGCRAASRHQNARALWWLGVTNADVEGERDCRPALGSALSAGESRDRAKRRATGVATAFERPQRVPAAVRSDLVVVECQPRHWGRSYGDVGRASAQVFRAIIVSKCFGFGFVIVLARSQSSRK